MEYAIVCSAALLASGLTLFSGFGLGTLLMPVVALFFPLEIAIAITAVVHLANNLFKLALLGRHAQPSVLLAFGLPAVCAAFLGAAVLHWLGAIPPLFAYSAFGQVLEVSALKLAIGVLIAVFVAMELSGRLQAVGLDRKWLPLGGLLSGFFGGLSGHQGAFRSLFLLKAGLDRDAFVATGIVLAVMVDLARMAVYGAGASAHAGTVDWGLVAAACAAAFLGAYGGARLLRKVTLRAVQLAVSVLLLLVALGLASGLL